jgi:hypothetical protein
MGSAACPQGKEKKKKLLNGRNLRVFSILAPYHSKSLQMLSLSLFVKSTYASQDIWGTEVYFIRSLHPCLCRGPPSSHASPLVCFDRVIFKLQAYRW